MKISYQWLASYFDGKLPDPNKLAESINAHSFEVEGIESAGEGARADTVLDIKVMPDRAHYALCHRGIAREVRAVLGLPIKAGKMPAFAGPVPCAVPAAAGIEAPSVTIAEPSLCSRYMARRIEGITVGNSSFEVASRLAAVGGRAINNVVDATNYVMFDIGQPLHAFDAHAVKGGIVVRKAAAGETIVLLDGREVALTVSDLVVADDEGPLAIAGVKGGKRAEVTASTTSIILESANFNPVSVRRTSTRLGLRNESSKRFENEIIPELAAEGIEMAADMICRSAGPIAAQAGPVTDMLIRATEGWSVTILPTLVSDRIGVNVTEAQARQILGAIGCAIEDKGDAFEVIPPHDRLDLKIPEDLVDEIARIIGYGSIPSVMPRELPERTPVDTGFYWSEKAKTVLASLGFSEALLYALVPKGAFEIAYPLASDKAALRESILSKLSDALTMNARNADLLGLKAIRLFEIGSVFPKSGEKTVLALGVMFAKKQKGVTPAAQIAAAISRLEEVLGLEIKAPDIRPVGDLGAVAEIDDWGAVVSSMRAAPCDLSDLGFAPLPADTRYVPFSPYPFIVRDIALFVPESMGSSLVWDVIRQGIERAGAAGLLVRYELFDEFKKDGRISYAFRMVFQAGDRTLTDEEVNGVMEQIYAVVRARGWEVR